MLVLVFHSRPLTPPCTSLPHCSPLAFQQPDQTRLLQLPGPHLNSLNKAEWAVSSSELSKAYRKLSILVHPDKAPGEAARQAFEQLKQAYNELRDPEKLVRPS
jgi:DnaJ family protein C protein 8